MMQLLKRWLPLFKWIWLILVVVTAGLYIQQNFDSIAGKLRTISLWRIVISSSLLIIGRLFIIMHATHIVRDKQYSLTYTDLFYIIGLSELGKYLPGGIWHFVGRTAYYRQAGLSLEDASRALLLELIWLAVSAICLGGALLIWGKSVLTAIFILILWGLAIVILKWRKDRTVRLSSVSYIVIIQAMIWLSIGLSYAILLPELPIKNWVFIIGTFTMSWLIGFVIVFAPGGLGTREVALATLSISFIPISTTLTIASIHRLLWVGVEVLLAVAALSLKHSEPGDKFKK